MAPQPLVESDKMVGEALLRELVHDSALGLREVFWWFDESHDDWRFYVASKYCDKHGQKATYLRLLKHLQHINAEEFPLYRIVASRTDNPVVGLVNDGIGHFRRFDPDGYMSTGRSGMSIYSDDDPLPPMPTESSSVDLSGPKRLSN